MARRSLRVTEPVLSFPPGHAVGRPRRKCCRFQLHPTTDRADCDAVLLGPAWERTLWAILRTCAIATSCTAPESGMFHVARFEDVVEVAQQVEDFQDANDED